MIGGALWDAVVDLFGPVVTVSAIILAGTGVCALVGHLRRARRDPPEH